MLEGKKEGSIMTYMTYDNRKRLLGTMMALEVALVIASVGVFIWTILNAITSENFSTEFIVHKIIVCIIMYLAGFFILFIDGELRNKWGIR